LKEVHELMPDEYSDENVQGLAADELVARINAQLEFYTSVEFFRDNQGSLIMRTWETDHTRSSE
jgi:hypothetical protein